MYKFTLCSLVFVFLLVCGGCYGLRPPSNFGPNYKGMAIKNVKEQDKWIDNCDFYFSPLVKMGVPYYQITIVAKDAVAMSRLREGKTVLHLHLFLGENECIQPLVISDFGNFGNVFQWVVEAASEAEVRSVCESDKVYISSDEYR